MENPTSGVTVDEIVSKSKQWTLEGDCTLLKWMEQISKNLEERAAKTTSDLCELSTKVERTSIALSNVTNSLAALQYTQFVENRVHDDDETLANVEEVPNPSADVVDKSTNDSSMYSFLKKNLEMMNSCHEAYAFSYDDSDEDEPATNVVYRSKNPYESRPLPHIYGTSLWKEKWHIGLCDSDTDFSGDENSEQFSESSSVTDNSYESTAQTMSEWDSTAWGLNANTSGERKQFRVPSNDGESSYTQSEVSTPTEQRRNRVPIVQPVQDQRYYQHVPRIPQEKVFDDIFDDSVQSTPQRTAAPPQSVVAASPPPVHQEKVYHESLIPDEPPPDDLAGESEPNKRLGAKKTLNLFDDDEFSSFMNQIVETAKTVKGAAPPPAEEVREPPKKVVPNLFEDHDDLFVADNNDTFEAPKKAVQPKVEEKTFVPSSPPKAAARTKIKNLFEDDDDDDDFEKMFANKSAGASQSEGNQFLKKTTNLFDNDSDVENDVAAVAAAPSKAVQVKQAEVKEVPLIKKGLFDDEEDDIFKIEKPSIKKPSERKNLFSEYDISEPPKATVVQTPKEPGDVEAAKVSEVPQKKPDFADLFQDEPPDDIFPPTPSVRKAKVADIFADDFEDDFEEFLPKVSKEATASVSKEATADVEKPAAAAKVDFSDLFPDEPPEDNVPSSSMTKAPKMAELFGDEFGDEPEFNQGLGAKDEPSTALKASKMAELFADEFANEPESDPFEDSKPNQGLGAKDTPSTALKATKIPALFGDEFTDEPESNPLEDSKPSQDVGAKDSPSAASKVAKLPELFADEFGDETEQNPAEVSVLNPGAGAKETTATTSKPAKISKLFAEELDKDPEPSPFTDSAPNPGSGAKEMPAVASKATKMANLFADGFGDESEADPRQDSAPNPGARSKETSAPALKAPKTTAPALENEPKPKPLEDSAPNPGPGTKETASESEGMQASSSGQAEKKISKSQDILKTPPVDEGQRAAISNEKPSSKDPRAVLEGNPKQEVAASSFSSLFPDEPPSDDELPTVSSATEKDAAKFSSINLFADVPPDDDDFQVAPPAETKRIHSIFYDDFNETIEASREMRAPSSYIFNDEPPPDDDVQMVDKSQSQPQAQPPTTQPQAQPKVVDEKKEKVKVSKLKKFDLQINVNALLPTAKMPSFKKPEAVPQRGDISTTPVAATPTAIPTGIPTTARSSEVRAERDVPENILPNLNRDRVKMGVKRRPSTRKGRQESYRKSMLEEEAVAKISDNEDDVHSEEPEVKKTLLNTRKLQDKSPNPQENVPNPQKAIPEQQEEVFSSRTFLSKIPPSIQEDERKRQRESQSRPAAAPSKATSLFEDFGDFGSGKLSLPKVGSDSLFHDNDEVVNPFGTPKTTPVRTSMEATGTVSHTTVSLFEDTDPPPRKEVIAPTSTLIKPMETKAASSKPATTKPSATVVKSSKVSSLFGDSDDGSDDLFKEPISMKKPTQQKPAESQPKKEPKMEPKKEPKKELLPKPAKPPSASLFSSDEGSESDDIFGKSKLKVAPKKLESTKSKQSSSLFADISDDDEDDLFGTSKKKSTAADKAKAKSSTQQPTKTTAQPQQQQPTTTSYNPLSDLLGD